jgi:hypothetical protein
VPNETFYNTFPKAYYDYLKFIKRVMQRTVRAGQNRHKYSVYVMGCQRYAFACSINSGHCPFTEVLTVGVWVVYNLATFYLQRGLMDAVYVATNEYVIKQIAKGIKKLPRSLITDLNKP